MDEKFDFAKEFREILEQQRKEETKELETKFENMYGLIKLDVRHWFKFTKINNGKVGIKIIYMFLIDIKAYISLMIHKEKNRKGFLSNYTRSRRFYESILRMVEPVTNYYKEEYPDRLDEIKELDNIEIILYFNNKLDK